MRDAELLNKFGVQAKFNAMIVNDLTSMMVVINVVEKILKEKLKISDEDWNKIHQECLEEWKAQAKENARKKGNIIVPDGTQVAQAEASKVQQKIDKEDKK
jgi:hypothetical protein